MLIAAMTFVGCSALILSNLLKCVSVNNQECKASSGEF